MQRFAKFARALALVALFLIAAVFLVWLIQFGEPSKQQAEWEIKNQNEAKAVEILATERMAYYTNVLAVVTAGLLVFGIVQILYLIRADKNAIRTVESMEDTARRQLRAYIFVSGKPDHLPEFSDEFGISVWLVAKNSGQTPAYKVRQWNAINFRADPHAGPFDRPSQEEIDGKAPQASIGPNGDVPLRAFYARDKITDEHIVAINEGKLTICVWGELTYEDAFGNQRYTRYRFFLPVEKGGRMPGIQISRDGNEAS